MNPIAFNFSKYYFTEAVIKFPKTQNEDLSLSVSFFPEGRFYKDKYLYELNLSVKVFVDIEGEKQEMIHVNCVSEFQFQSEIEYDQIPDFFYPNSIAIVFPYIRAFVSTLTLQANVNPVVLPTMNLTSLKDELKTKTTVI